MAYNLQPLITILQQILNPEQTRQVVDHNKPQLESLLKKAVSLQQILENSLLPQNIESLESQIREAAHRAEDIIEAHMVDQMLSIPQGVSFTFSTPDLQKVMQQLDFIMEQVVELVQEKMMPSGSSSSGPFLLPDLNLKSAEVGVDEDLMQLKDRLIGMQSKLEILPIVGMGGIGKTTLARKLYQHPSIVDHFSYLAWTTISQDYNMRAIVLGLIRCIVGKECDQHMEKGDSELKDILYQSLYGRRYMIVLDDIWSTKFWDEIQMYFPDNNNWSRIVITTRESNVAKYVDSKSVQHQVQLLSESQSWDLLRQIVFGEEDCPHELQGIGEKIASDCGGLPLAISVIGGLLSKVERSKDVWENIGNNVRAAIGESDKQFSNILSLSYNHLPVHLKPCFLYMGAFPEDYEINASRLIRLWVAEGFVKVNRDKSFEEEAEDYLKSLVERNLVSVRSYHWYGKPKSYSMHDLLRDLCIRKAFDDKFLCVKDAPEVTFSNMRRVRIHTPYGMKDDDYASSGMSLARSFLLFIELDSFIAPVLSPMFFTLSLLRVLDLLETYIGQFPKGILQLVNLRYLAIDCYSLPSGISRLCNLQTLIANSGGDAPPDLLEMSELRHLIRLGACLVIKDYYVKKPVLKKLQTMWGVKLCGSEIRGGFLERIPNIEKLYICDDGPVLSEVVDLTHLHKLQTLRCDLDYTLLRRLKFPSTLRELILVRCVITPVAMTALCALPNLEELKIYGCNFKSNETEEEANEEWEIAEGDEYEEWEIAEGDEFRSLQFLLLGYLQLVRWRADETNFPRLRHLLIENCNKLEEIPAGFGEISTLQLIHLEACSDSAVASAKQIQEEQQSEYGNYDLQLRIVSYDD